MKSPRALLSGEALLAPAINAPSLLHKARKLQFEPYLPMTALAKTLKTKNDDDDGCNQGLIYHSPGADKLEELAKFKRIDMAGVQTLALESRVPSGSGGRRIQSGKNEEEDKEEDEEGFYPLGLYPQLRKEMKLSITELNIFQTRNLGSFTK
ncbi:hypothetical protein TURU_157178 [Turdus rufiventris]|nr:hypothetical protein TURU_157178 [Turdus rufiventris]